MKTINIMTSCDGNLMKFIPIQLESIVSHLKDTNINFYLFHDNKDKNFVTLLKKIEYDNLKFYDVVVEENDIYEMIAKYGGHWNGAAYYSLCAHKYLPADMDRILYLDAADTLIIDNIDEYYFLDFENNALIATAAKYKFENNKISLFEKSDIFNKKNFALIARGLFNSGSYIINLNYMREKNYDILDYLNEAQNFCSMKHTTSKVYWGDQGFLSLMFVGKIKFFDYPKTINIWHMPYNFCMWYFDKVRQKPNFSVSIIHFTGKFKPWLGMYPVFLYRFQDEKNLHDLNELKLGQAQYYYMWHEYAILTDIRLDNCAIEEL